MVTAEIQRLQENRARTKYWRRWGPYLAERAWGVPREDYSANGDAWQYFTFDDAIFRAYRWTEDGIAGICDNHQRLCFAFAFWNGRDPILKDRLFGLSGPEGNHGEDVKELYYYLDSTPTHSYMKCLYKYPQREFPYADLRKTNAARNRDEFEYELLDTGIFEKDEYFDVFFEYAKSCDTDMIVRATIFNRAANAATLHFLPTLWFRNTWSWPLNAIRPQLSRLDSHSLTARESTLGEYTLTFEGSPVLLFTENDTNPAKLEGQPSGKGYFKDAFHERVVRNREDAVAPNATGTKAALWYTLEIAPGQSQTLTFRLCAKSSSPVDPDQIFRQRQKEADEFYSFQRADLSPDARDVQRQAFAGLLWSKQFYHYIIDKWMKGDPAQPPPPKPPRSGRNRSWEHLYSDDVLSMPDKWEYPWFAAWDLSFHMISFALIDPEFAKSQLSLFLREWYQSPNGQLPAYEWEFSDVNPPVHAWACWRVFKIDSNLQGTADYPFLEAAFHKLLMNFTWWVNRKDSSGNNIFEGGFLGLDNIGVIDRSAPLPYGGTMEQADATAWMAMYCVTLLRIAIELTPHDGAYEDIASKFFEHFLYIASAINRPDETGLWDEQDGFYYDWIKAPDRQKLPMRVRSIVGLIPLLAVTILDQDKIDKMEGFKRRMDWFIEHRPDLCGNIASITNQGVAQRRLLSMAQPDKLKRVLHYMLDENEFLSPYGIRSVSRYHLEHPFNLEMEGHQYGVDYEPAESRTGMFGGNSNWRGPIWFPINYLLIEALQRYHHYFGDDFKVEFPSNSGNLMPLGEIAAELSRRMARLFLKNDQGRRPVYGAVEKLQTDPNFRDYILFFEYFHGDNGAGLGASHQTGWTALVAKLMQQNGT